ncbi:M14 family zinc carboxypeptidase [Nocardioides sp. SLBN-35]|uniref:M14 family zinc carboxypeptidase n=1 Tax=Nocardioides sp. SLBN-35 TaxID=2768445 RepID=UPI00114E0EFE|nr:M14 family zinc carboxypeptidase [Nocardioides sp. SLBN-35]TQK68287.1 zinc carboxypeptidase [Nocardioides sp. SLBN-35]
MRRLLAALAATLVVVAGAAVVVPAHATTTRVTASAYVQTSVVIGTSARGRPIRAYYRGEEGAPYVLLVLGQMHGDEKDGIATARWIRDHAHPRPGTGVWVVPTLNPDGNARGTRTNGRGVDLNRNWPTSGWSGAGRGSRYWGGPRPGSEPETKAMIAFLTQVRPDRIASIHQPLRAIGRGGHGKWEKRLARFLHLPRRHLGVGNPSGTDSPTLTAWYDTTLGEHGAATTIEYGARTSHRYRTKVAGRGILRAARIH